MDPLVSHKVQGRGDERKNQRVAAYCLNLSAVVLYFVCINKKEKKRKNRV